MSEQERMARAGDYVLGLMSDDERERAELDLERDAAFRDAVLAAAQNFHKLDLTATALHESPALEEFGGRVSDSGEGRWTSIAAIETGAPAPVLTTALFERFSSRGEADFADRLLSAMRKQFGGHAEKPA